MSIAWLRADSLFLVAGASLAGWLLRIAYERRFRRDHQRLLLGLVREALASTSDLTNAVRTSRPESSDNDSTTVYERPPFAALRRREPKTTVLFLDEKLRRQLIEGSRR